MRSIKLLILFLTFLLVAAAPASANWRQVHPHWHDAYVISFRSPDLLSNEPDERWGEEDGRLVSGGVLSDFPAWLRSHRSRIADARRLGRPILISLHFHSGYGTGLVSYTINLRQAEVASYPWLIRQLLEEGLGDPDVTVVVDTCNAQATASHQLRPDLVPQGIEAWPPFAAWRRSDPARRNLAQPRAYMLFSQDRVAKELRAPAKGQRSAVKAEPYQPLTAEERRQFRANLYGQKGVVLATPGFFNVLRLGPNPKGTNTANLMRGALDRRLHNSLLAENKAEFARFKEFRFFTASGARPAPPIPEPVPAAPVIAADERDRQDAEPAPGGGDAGEP